MEGFKTGGLQAPISGKGMSLTDFHLPEENGFEDVGVWVNNRVTPKWVAPGTGNMDALTCGPYPGALILTQTHIPY